METLTLSAMEEKQQTRGWKTQLYFMQGKWQHGTSQPHYNFTPSLQLLLPALDYVPI